MMHKHLAKVRINGKCWEWVGRRSQNGYGYFRVAGRDHRATHYLWFLVWHRWPEETLLHSCDHPWCVNPDHLSEGPPSEDTQPYDAYAPQHYAQKSQCIHGHPFDEINTYRYMERRMCKACARIRQLKKRIERATPVEPIYVGAEFAQV